MNSLSEQLATTLSETKFDLEYIKVTGTGNRKPVSKRGLTASEFANICHSHAHDHGIIGKRASVHTPTARMAELVKELRIVLGLFIDPDSDCLGHAFPIDHSGDSVSLRTRSDGLYEFEFKSTVESFANSLVQAAAIIGVDKAMQLLTNWKSGDSVRFRTSTFINGLTLNTRQSPREDIEIIPLSLTTSELPRLPNHDRLYGEDYLGQTVLSLTMSASPALFRPKTGAYEANVLSEKGINIDFVCDALSLQANCYVSQSFMWWTEYEEAAPFSLMDWQTLSSGTNSFEHARRKRIQRNYETGVATLKRADDVMIVSLDEGDVMHTIEALQSADRKLSIAVDRWKRSKRLNARLEDRYIDLRIALETLYLKDFVNENSGEMRFRLSLFGAWHLGANLDERRSIRKALREAYDTASGAVHSGEVLDNKTLYLKEAQDLCRQGILKLLSEGAPKDWGDLILGASLS